MTYYTQDYGLVATQLEDKYEKWGAHPGYPVTKWVRAVNLDATLLGYWDWVYYQLVEEQEELDRCNPYNLEVEL